MRLVVAALLGLAALAPSATAQDVARLDRAVPIAAHDGWLAWSARGADDRFRLTLRDPRGAVTTPAIPSRSISFDVDLGPGPRGVVAAYSRCREEVPSSGGGQLPADYDEGRGCDAFLLELGTGAERRLRGVSTPTADETWPTVWRDRVAFVRSYDRAPTRPHLYVRSLAGGVSARQPGGTRRVCDPERVCTDPRVSRPYALDLAGRHLVFGWAFAGRTVGLDTEIRLDTIGGGHRRIAREPGEGTAARAIGWPDIDAGRVFFSAACGNPDLGGCAARPELLRYGVTSRLTRAADADPSSLAHARDGDLTWLLVDTAPKTECQGDPAVPGGTCVLRAVRPAFR